MGHLLVFGSYNKAGNATNYMDKKSFLKILHKYQQGKSTEEEQDFLESYYNLFDLEEGVVESNLVKEKLRRSILNEISKSQPRVSNVRFIGPKFLRFAAAIVLFMIIGASVFYFINKSQAYDKVELLAEEHKENRVIFLPDGSKVILSTDSKLNYPSTFDGLENREVTLTGEGYFDISHDASKPFIVHSGKLKTVVIGTVFNIKAISGQENITVTVKRGKVKVVNQEDDKVLGIITPNQQIVYNVKKVNSVMSSVQTENYLTWMKEDLFCDNLTLISAVELLEERYKVKIEIEDQSKWSRRFTTTFSKREKIENILETICLFNDLEYEYNSDRSCFAITNKKITSSLPKNLNK